MGTQPCLNRNTIAGACLLVSLLPAPLLSAGEDGAPVPSADIWQRDVVSMEPIWVRIEVTNRSDHPVAIVPPYVDCYRRARWPLTFLITREDGSLVLNGWRGAPLGTEPVAYGLPWWRPHGRGLPVRLPWELTPGASAYMWFDLCRFYPLDEPGRYHILLLYRPARDMLGTRDHGPPARETLWLEAPNIDAGWIDVRAPEGPDAEAVAFLREKRHQPKLVLSADVGVSVARRVLERYPDSSHALHAEFMAIASGLQGGVPVTEETRHELDTRAGRFAALHPGFPLLYQFDLLRVYGEWCRAIFNISPEELIDIPTHRRIRRRMGTTEQALREAIEQTRDFELRQRVEVRLWRWHHIEEDTTEG